MKGYWISLYLKVDNQDNLKKYSETVTPIIKSFGGIPLVRGGQHKTFDGDDFVRSIIWEFPSYEKALEWYNSEEYKPIKQIRLDNSEGTNIIIKGIWNNNWFS